MVKIKRLPDGTTAVTRAEAVVQLGIALATLDRYRQAGLLTTYRDVDPGGRMVVRLDAAEVRRLGAALAEVDDVPEQERIEALRSALRQIEQADRLMAALEAARRP